MNKDNKVYLDNLVQQDQNEERERQRAEWREWNPELLEGYIYIPTAQNNSEQDQEQFKIQFV